MKDLIHYILQFGQLTDQEVELILSRVEEIELNKESYFSEAGKIPNQVGFIVEGVIRGYYHNSEGDEITRHFIMENSLVSDYINFDSNSISNEYIQTLTDCKILVFSRKNWNDLSKEILGWDVIKNKMVQHCMHQKSRKNPVISQDASTRYLDFIKNYPSIVNRVPLLHIASYLGVTQQSLSRIRRNIK